MTSRKKRVSSVKRETAKPPYSNEYWKNIRAIKEVIDQSKLVTKDIRAIIKEPLKQLYLDQRIPVDRIARDLNRAVITIYEWLVKANIPRKPPRLEAALIKELKELNDRGLLTEQRIKEMKRNNLLLQRYFKRYDDQKPLRIKPSLVTSLLRDGRNSVKSLSEFWRLKPTNGDMYDLDKYLTFLKLRRMGFGNTTVVKVIGRSEKTLENWSTCRKMPRIIRLLDIYLTLGKPGKGWKWLSVNRSKGDIFTGPWIRVPEKLHNFRELAYVINQLPILGEAYERATRFSLPTEEARQLRYNLFAYLLGVIVGDLGKGIQLMRKRTQPMNLKLNPTKRYEWNLRFGEFVSLCANTIGIRMHRIKDVAPDQLRPDGQYRWISAVSPLLKWVFNICLGLKDKETTTENPVRMWWLFTAPKDFIRFFLQGLADSDGFTDPDSHAAGVIAQPNENLVWKLVTTLQIRTHKRAPKAVRMDAREAAKIPLFSPHVKSHRYTSMTQLAMAHRFARGEPWPDWIRDILDRYMNAQKTIDEIRDEVLNKHQVWLDARNIRKYFERKRRKN